MSNEFINTVTQPQFWIASGHKIAIILMVIALFVFLLKMGEKSRKLMVEKRILSERLSQVFYTILRWTLIAFLLLLVLQQIGLSINNVWTMLSAFVAMIAIGFVAVWSVLSNVLCTVLLLVFRPFRVGDEVEIVDPVMTSGLGGTVQNINLIFTTLKTEDEDETAYIQIPNNMFFQKLIRKKIGKKTYTLDKQIFEEQSLLKNGGN